MKTFIKLASLLLLVVMALPTKAQGPYINVCPGDTGIITGASYFYGFSSPSYSMNPGGVVSPSGTFAVSPFSASTSYTTTVTYTVYATGFNSLSGVVETDSVSVTAHVGGAIYNVFCSSPTYNLGCGSQSLISISIAGAQSISWPVGAPVSFTLLSPGSSTLTAPTTSGFNNVFPVTTPGIWYAVVKDMTSGCVSYSPVVITQNTVPPTLSGLAVSPTTLSCDNPTAMIVAGGNPYLQYGWLPGTLQGTTTVFSNSVQVAANFAAPSSSIAATLTLAVTDLSTTCQSTTFIAVYQNMRPPIPLISSSSPGACGYSLSLTNSSITDILAGTFFVSQPVVATLWEGPSPQPTASLSSTYLAYTSGVYTMTVMDLNNGCTSYTTITVNVGPDAAFTHTVTGGQVAFSDISTGTNANTLYYWDFGDGITSTQENPTHTYLIGGAYTVEFKVTDPTFLCSDSVMLSVNVSGIPCSANSNFSMVPTSTTQVWNVIPGYPWNVSAAVWNWGDGTTSNILYTAHQYATAGLYNICLTVTVSCGDTSTTCTSYTIYRVSQEAMFVKINVIPPALIAGLASVSANEQFSWDILPNPNAGEFKLNLNNAKTESVRIVISDITGQNVYDQSLELDLNSRSIHTDGLPSGMYLVTVEANGLKATKHMIITR